MIENINRGHQKAALESLSFHCDKAASLRRQYIVAAKTYRWDFGEGEKKNSICIVLDPKDKFTNLIHSNVIYIPYIRSYLLALYILSLVLHSVCGSLK